MTIHRHRFRAWICSARFGSVCGAVARFAPRTNDRRRQEAARRRTSTIGRPCSANLPSGATGVWEGTTLAKGYGRDGFGHEWAEINGSEGSAVYRLHEPNTILLGRTGHDLAPVDVPPEFLKPAGSPRNPADGKPATVFRYDLMWEFVSAIVEGRAGGAQFSTTG